MNNISSTLMRSFQGRHYKEQNLISFQPGQIWKGKIVKMFSNGIASLQIGSQNVVAQLEAPIEVNQRYWFQVLPNEGKVRLKVLNPISEKIDNNKDSLIGLLKSLSIPVDEENKEMMRFYLQERLPVHKNSIEAVARWIKEYGSNSLSKEAIKWIEEKQLPQTKVVFQSILEVIKNDSFVEQITSLSNQLKTNNLTNSSRELALILQSLLKMEVDPEGLFKENNSNYKHQHLRQTDGMVNNSQTGLTGAIFDLIKKIGFSYEHHVLQSMEKNQNELGRKEALKPLLIEFLKEDLPIQIRETAEKILRKITGLQLLSQESGPIQQLVVQIPIGLWNRSVDLTIQWSGRKKENGQIDPEFCRVLFYLDLENLKDTIVDMQIQNRIITVNITNESERFKELASLYTEKLKDNLHTIGYVLSSVQFIQLPKQAIKKENHPRSSEYGISYKTGVDLRI